MNDDRIEQAIKSVKEMLNVEDLNGKSFLDIGSGSGLFSLAAKRLGANVYSFDYDTHSVACTKELKQRYYPNDPEWKVERGDALNSLYLRSLGKFDVVYSWGVLHHTGNMWKALDNVSHMLNPDGILFISIYNDQGIISKYWKVVKKTYVHSSPIIKRLMSFGFAAYFSFVLFLADLIRFRNPFNRYFGSQKRGMNFFRDIVDWIGGYPFEVADPEKITQFYRSKNYTLKKIKNCGKKQGCNEFVFIKNANPMLKN